MIATLENGYIDFNEKGIDGIVSKIHKHKPIKITDDIEKKIVEIATNNPRD